jgi:AraC-like DNA-binding protein
MPSVLVPISPLPRLVLAGRSVHGEIPRQAWRMEGVWGVHLYRYGADLTVAGQRVRLEHGHAGFTPPGALAAYRFEGRSMHLFAHLEFPSEVELREMPLAFPVGGTFAGLWAQMEEAIGLFPTDPRHAEVKVWDVWLSVLDAARAEETPLPAPVRKAIEMIEQRLHEPLSVAQIADEVSLSHNHLTRQFRAATGQTVIAAIQQRRMERARYLLQRSTMPIKEVASMVGIDDLQRFNKTVRRLLGASPSDVRGEGVRGDESGTPFDPARTPP